MQRRSVVFGMLVLAVLGVLAATATPRAEAAYHHMGEMDSDYFLQDRKSVV